MALSPCDALEAIQQIMSGQRWTPETLEAIADTMDAAGYTISNYDEEESEELRQGPKKRIRKDQFEPGNPAHFRLQTRGGAWRYYRRAN